MVFLWIYAGWHGCDGTSAGELRKEHWCVSVDFSLSKCANWIMWRAGPGAASRAISMSVAGAHRMHYVLGLI